MKRSAILLAGVAALAPVTVLSEAAAQSTTAEGEFVAPPSPLTLTRTIRKTMAGGRELAITRSYRVRFARDGEGYRVDGEQIAVDVEAPQGLRALAELERRRADTGLFPIFLDSNGQIVSSRSVGDSQAVAQASAMAQAQIARGALQPGDSSAATGFVQQVAQSGAESSWPADLFRPAPGRRSESRPMALPDGSQGEVSIAIEARARPGSGLMQAVDRTVITRLEGTERQTRELWTLQPLGMSNIQ